MEFIATEKAPAAIGPYAQAVKVGDFLYTSGQIPLTADAKLVNGDIEAQTEQVLSNLKAVLEEAGATKGQVVKVTVYLTDLRDFARVNERYAAFFGDHKPARSTVQVAALPKGVHIEMDMVAWLG